MKLGQNDILLFRKDSFKRFLSIVIPLIFIVFAYANEAYAMRVITEKLYLDGDQILEGDSLNLKRLLRRENIQVNRDAKLLEVQLVGFDGERASVTIEAGIYEETLRARELRRGSSFILDDFEVDNTQGKDWYLSVSRNDIWLDYIELTIEHPERRTDSNLISEVVYIRDGEAEDGALIHLKSLLRRSGAELASGAQLHEVHLIGFRGRGANVKMTAGFYIKTLEAREIKRGEYWRVQNSLRESTSSFPWDLWVSGNDIQLRAVEVVYENPQVIPTHYRDGEKSVTNRVDFFDARHGLNSYSIQAYMTRVWIDVEVELLEIRLTGVKDTDGSVTIEAGDYRETLSIRDLRNGETFILNEEEAAQSGGRFWKMTFSSGDIEIENIEIFYTSAKLRRESRNR